MGKIILLIGPISCGKTTLARKIVQEEGALHISADDMMRRIFPDPLGDMYDVYSRRCLDYLYLLAGRLAEGGVTPVLDFGFWQRSERERVRGMLEGHELDWRYLQVEEGEWRRRIDSRNAAVREGRANPDEYAVDDGLLHKAVSRFEPPTPEEIPGLTIINA